MNNFSISTSAILSFSLFSSPSAFSSLPLVPFYLPSSYGIVVGGIVVGGMVVGGIVVGGIVLVVGAIVVVVGVIVVGAIVVVV